MSGGAGGFGRVTSFSAKNVISLQDVTPELSASITSSFNGASASPYAQKANIHTSFQNNIKLFAWNIFNNKRKITRRKYVPHTTLIKLGEKLDELLRQGRQGCVKSVSDLTMSDILAIYSLIGEKPDNIPIPETYTALTGRPAPFVTAQELKQILHVRSYFDAKVRDVMIQEGMSQRACAVGWKTQASTIAYFLNFYHLAKHVPLVTINQRQKYSGIIKKILSEIKQELRLFDAQETHVFSISKKSNPSVKSITDTQIHTNDTSMTCPTRKEVQNITEFLDHPMSFNHLEEGELLTRPEEPIAASNDPNDKDKNHSPMNNNLLDTDGSVVQPEAKVSECPISTEAKIVQVPLSFGNDIVLCSKKPSKKSTKKPDKRAQKRGYSSSTCNDTVTPSDNVENQPQKKSKL